MLCQLFSFIKTQIMLKYCVFLPLKRFGIIFFCIFVEIFRGAKRLRTLENALKRNFKIKIII